MKTEANSPDKDSQGQSRTYTWSVQRNIKKSRTVIIWEGRSISPTKNVLLTLPRQIYQQRGWLREPYLSDETASKYVYKEYRERSKTLNEVNPVKNRDNIPRSFQGASHVHSPVPPSHELQDHASSNISNKRNTSKYK